MRYKNTVLSLMSLAIALAASPVTMSAENYKVSKVRYENRGGHTV